MADPAGSRQSGGVHVDDLVSRIPRLFHTAPAQAWPGIRAHGLLPADRLLELYEVDGAEPLLSRRRPVAHRLAHPVHGEAWLRDQRPMNEAHLGRMLEGTSMTVAEYLRRINSLVFFWADPARLERLRDLPRYADQAQLVLTVDTASLLAVHGDRVVLTRINSGAALFPSGRRGPDTFRAIADFPSRVRPVELAVVGGVPDLARHLLRAQRWSAGQAEDLVDVEPVA